MKVTPPQIEEYLNLLVQTSRCITKATKGLDEARLKFRSDKEPWSANDILAHLRSCADVWGDSIEAMLAEQNPHVPYRHPRQWIKKTDYLELSFRESFRAFIVQRKKLIKVLKTLPFED